jgi:hypothetical protein
MTAGVTVPIEALVTLRRRLAALPGLERAGIREVLIKLPVETIATIDRRPDGESGHPRIPAVDRGGSGRVTAAALEGR